MTPPPEIAGGTGSAICPSGQGAQSSSHPHTCRGSPPLRCAVEGSMATLERIGPTGHDLVVLDEPRGRLSIGKNATNDLILDDPAVSRVHAVLEHIGPSWCITDVGSTNGTSVNGERIFALRTLADRDEILVGRTRL